IHPGYSALFVQCINLIRSPIGNACEKRFVRDCFSFRATKIGDVTCDHQNRRLDTMSEWLDDYGDGVFAFGTSQDLDCHSLATLQSAVDYAAIRVVDMPKHFAARRSLQKLAALQLGASFVRLKQPPIISEQI